MSTKAKDFDFNNYFDFQKRALAPWIEASELTLKHMEKITRHGYEAIGEAIELGMNQARITLSAKDASQLAAKQTELASEFVAKQTARSQELMKIAATGQAEFGKWFQSANEEFNATLRKSA